MVGAWWQFRPLQAAALSGLVLFFGFVLSRLQMISHGQAIAFYLAAIPFGGWFWVREGYEELVHEHVVGIEVLMAAATVGAAALGQWEDPGGHPNSPTCGHPKIPHLV